MAAIAALLNQAVAAVGEPRSFFFNGRLLTAEDLRREQGLREGGQRRLARLIGCGVADGLEVTAAGSSVTISAGLGVTPSGEVLEIDDLQLDLAGAATAGSGTGFGDCGAGIAAGMPLAGVHLLVLSPAWTPQGRAQTLLGEVGSCNRRVEQPAVRARLLSVQAPGAASPLTERNLIAAGLLSPGEGLAAVAAGERLGWWPRQRQSSTTGASVPTLSADDLPLAVLRLKADAKVDFMDMHSARRRLAPPPGEAGDSLWPMSWGVEVEAFAAQVLGLLSDTTLAARAAALPDPLHPLDASKKAASEQAFEWLPPLVVLTPAQLTNWRRVFKETALAPAAPVVLSREGFAHALEGGLRAGLVRRATAQVKLAQLHGHPERLLLRLRGPGETDDGGGGSVLFGRNERTSPAVASMAARLLNEGRKLKRGEPIEGPAPTAAELSVAASALTQAPDRQRATTAGKPTGKTPAKIPPRNRRPR